MASEIFIHKERPLPKKLTGNSYWSAMNAVRKRYLTAIIGLKPGESLDAPFDISSLRCRLYNQPGVFAIRQISSNQWGVWRTA
jgi:hypothetical protein